MAGASSVAANASLAAFATAEAAEDAAETAAPATRSTNGNDAFSSFGASSSLSTSPSKNCPATHERAQSKSRLEVNPLGLVRLRAGVSGLGLS